MADKREWFYLFKRDAKARIGEGKLTIDNLRDHTHNERSERYLKREYKLNDLERVWLAVEPLQIKAFSHIFLIFDFKGENLVLSVEAKRREGQARPVLWGFLPLFPISYTCTTERDSFELRSAFRGYDVFLYKLKLNKKECRHLLFEVVRRMNEVQGKNLLFNSLYRNCTSEIINALENAFPDKISSKWKKYWSTGIDSYLYKKGLIDTDVPLKELRKKHNVSPHARTYKEGDFSSHIRKNL
jgi:hypothetical protein